MKILLIRAIEKSGRDDFQFFQSAYFKIFQKHGNVWKDIAQWRLEETIPVYVEKYIRYIYDL